MSTDPAVKLREQLRKLLGLLQDERTTFRAKEDAILHEIDALLGGQPGIGAILKHAEEHFSALWSTRYPPGPYVFAYLKERPTLKQRIRQLGIEEVEGRMVDYLQRHTDEFLVKARHPFGLFLSTINRYDALASPAARWECSHTPRCPHYMACWVVSQRSAHG